MAPSPPTPPLVLLTSVERGSPGGDDVEELPAVDVVGQEPWRP
jgi:hypothetical protein